MDTYIVHANLHKLSDQISKLKWAIPQISLENRKLRSELVITQNVNSRLEEKIINLETVKLGAVKPSEYCRAI